MRKELEYNPSIVKYLAFNSILKDGYKPTSEDDSTVSYILNNYSDMATPNPIDMDNWVNSLKLYSEYLQKAAECYKKQAYTRKDLGFVASLISNYIKALDKANEPKKESAGYLGQEGEKVSFEVVEDRVLYSISPYTYYGDCSYAHRLVDTKGHIIIWKTTLTEIKPGSIVNATIKSTGKYNEEEQTTITRGKIEC